MELKYLDLFKCYWILTDSGWSPPGGGGGGWGLNGGLGMMWGWQGWCWDDRDDMEKMGKTWGWQGRQGRHQYHDKHVGSHLHYFTCVCTCVRACACMCMHVHMCGDNPYPPDPQPPTCPLSRATGSPKHQNSITLELIEIIQFCLKILYLSTFLNSYRL